MRCVCCGQFLNDYDQCITAGCGGTHVYDFDRACGAHVCRQCDDHKGLARCFCGWSASGRDGYRELIEMGETIEEEC